MANLRTLVRRAVKDTASYRVQQLLDEESKWQRRETIARNKLFAVRRILENELVTMAGQIDKAKLPAEVKPTEVKPTVEGKDQA